jgi:hypothetical protein
MTYRTRGPAISPRQNRQISQGTTTSLTRPSRRSGRAETRVPVAHVGVRTVSHNRASAQGVDAPHNAGSATAFAIAADPDFADTSSSPYSGVA